MGGLLLFCSRYMEFHTDLKNSPPKVFRTPNWAPCATSVSRAAYYMCLRFSVRSCLLWAPGHELGPLVLPLHGHPWNLGVNVYKNDRIHVCVCASVLCTPRHDHDSNSIDNSNNNIKKYITL